MDGSDGEFCGIFFLAQFIMRSRIGSESDSTDTCYYHVGMTKNLVNSQQHKIKTYSLSFIEALNRPACINVLKIINERNQRMSKYGIDYAENFSARFQRMMNIHLNECESQTPNPLQIIHDTLRYQSVLCYTVARSPLAEVVNILNIIFSEYPELFEYHQDYMNSTHPAILRLLKRRKQSCHD